MKKQSNIFIILIALLSNTIFTGASLSQPDLVVSWDDLDQNTANVGDLVRAEWKSKNRGTARSSSCRTSIWLSTDKYWDEFDIYLNSGGTTSLDPGEYDEDGRSFIVPSVSPGKYYVVFYADKAEDLTSVVDESDETNNENWEVLNINGPSTDIIVENSNPTEYSLLQNYPNPFNPSTSINFAVKTDANVTLRLFNALGQEVRTILNDNYATGNYKIDFNATGLSSGVYFYTMDASGVDGSKFAATKKLMLMK